MIGRISRVHTGAQKSRRNAFSLLLLSQGTRKKSSHHPTTSSYLGHDLDWPFQVSVDITLVTILIKMVEAIADNGPERLKAFLQERRPGEYSELETFYRGFYRTPESVRIIADACRNSGWRLPLAQAGFLSLIRTLSTTASERGISQQILRFVANCCADNNACRDMVLNDLDKLSACLADGSLFDFTVVALNNICDDYDPAVDAGLKHDTHGALSAALCKMDHDPERQSISMAVSLFVSLVYRAISTEKLTNILTVPFIGETLALPVKCHDWDNFAELVDMVIMLFQDENVQRWLAKHGSMTDILTLLEDIHNRMDQRTGSDSGSVRNEDIKPEIADELETLQKYADDIRSTLCDIAGMSENRKEKMHGNDFTVHALEKWLADWTCDWKMYTAALVLGNVTQSDAIAITFVNDFELNHVVTSAMNTSNDKQVLYACGGLLRNLCLPEKNFLVRASADTFVAARKLMLHEDHDKRLFVTGLRVLRQCIRDFGACQLLILKMSAESKLSLHTIIQFLEEHGEGDTNLKAEIGRAAVMMYRTCNLSKCPTVANLLDTLNHEKKLIDAMVELTILGVDTHLESEGWFGLALAAKLKDGALAVYQALKDLDSVDKLIQRVQSAQTAEQDATKTTENAKVLAATLANIIPNDLGKEEMEALKMTQKIADLPIS